MRNIVICCDGTNNQLTTAPTNVLRLFNCLDLKDPGKQIAFYDPGVGTLAHPGLTNPISQQLSLAYGLAFGVGFTRNLEEAYRFLMVNYRPTDRLFLFGFSRGAFTVRALAGMLRMFGLLWPRYENLLPYVSRAYMGANFEVMKRTLPFARRPIHIDFLGLWDSVTSLGFSYARKALPYTTNNIRVHTVRHAVAIDERRAYFRQNLWGRQHAKTQDIKEVWFAGVHSDVGGGYPESEGTLSKVPFEWMIEEARRPGPHTGLLIDPKYYERELMGADRQSGPDAGGMTHESLQGAWWALEFLPKNATLKRNEFFIPLGRRRVIHGDPDHAVIVHQSVLDRMASHEEYRPANLPKPHGVEPWSNRPAPISASRKVPLAQRVLPLLRGCGWVVIVYYLLFAIAFIVGLLVLALVRDVIFSDTKPEWALGLGRALTWPHTVTLWLLVPEHAWGTLVLVFPFLVFALGLWLLGRFSKLDAFTRRVTDSLLHLRWLGYDSNRAMKQFTDLGTDGLVAYRKALRIDLLFPFFYATALAAALYEAGRLASPLPWWLESLYPPVLVLPLVTALCDWAENLLLIRQIRRFESSRDVSDPGIRLASVATQIKLLTYAVATGILAVVMLVHLFR